MERARISRYVFPGQAEGKPLSNMALLTLLKRMNSVDKKWIDPTGDRPITAHGFRATFRTWAEEVATFPHAVIEQAMGHQVGTQVERAYRRTDILEKRRALMDAWAAHCEPNTWKRARVRQERQHGVSDISNGYKPTPIRAQFYSPRASAL